MDKNILILDGDPEKCAKMYPDGLILKAQREIICLITPCDYLKNLYEFLCYEYQKRFGKKSRYLSRWKISEIKEVQVNQERNKLYELVGKGERIEWRLDVPEWWNRQENKGRLWCKNKCDSFLAKVG